MWLRTNAFITKDSPYASNIDSLDTKVTSETLPLCFIFDVGNALFNSFTVLFVEKFTKTRPVSICLSVCVSVVYVCFPRKRFLRNYGSHHNRTWHGVCLRHNNASCVHYIDLDFHSRTRIIIMNKCSIISETKLRETTLTDWLLGLHWVASLCQL